MRMTLPVLAIAVAVVVRLLLAPGISAVARDTDINAVERQFHQSISAGQYQDAEHAAEQLLQWAEQHFGTASPNAAAARFDLASAYYFEGRYAEAEKLYQDSLAFAQQYPGKAGGGLANTLSNLATVQEAEGRYGEAVQLRERVLAMYEKAPDPKHLELGKALNNLANIYQDIGRYNESIPLYQRVIAIREKALAPQGGRRYRSVSFSSMRRFLRKASSLVPVSSGWNSPKPAATSRFAGTPLSIR
jgi:tetratricopeptide (TPR) repeat protein